jgi:hypothetical protein
MRTGVKRFEKGWVECVESVLEELVGGVLAAALAALYILSTALLGPRVRADFRRASAASVLALGCQHKLYQSR